jgi:serine/threonine protein kinase
MFGTVFCARDKVTGQEVAIKRQPSEEDGADGVPSQVLREVSILRNLRHPNIVQMKGILFCDRDKFVRPGYYMVMEYLSTDLHRTLREHRRHHTRIPMEEVCGMWEQILSALHELHMQNIVHRDVKPQNILLNPEDSCLKLCDFGLARVLNENSGCNYTKEVVTLWYRGPELLLGAKGYGAALDVWSAGSVAAEVATAYPLFPGDSEIDTIMMQLKLLGRPEYHVGASLLYQVQVASTETPGSHEWRFMTLAGNMAFSFRCAYEAMSVGDLLRFIRQHCNDEAYKVLKDNQEVSDTGVELRRGENVVLRQLAKESWPGHQQMLLYWSESFPRWRPTGLQPIRDARPELGEPEMDLLRKLLVMNPEARLTARQALRHEVFQR